MPDIKIKPQMDQLKVRVVNNTPKDIFSILRKEYIERQKEECPYTKDPVQYATDYVETAGKLSTIVVADSIQSIRKTQFSSKKTKFLKDSLRKKKYKYEEEHVVMRSKTGNLAKKEQVITAHSKRVDAKKKQIPRFQPAGVKQGAVLPKGNVSDTLKQSVYKRAKQVVHNTAQKRMLIQTVKKAKQGIKAGMQVFAKGMAAMGRIAAAAISSIVAAGGGLALFLLLLVVIVIGAIATSPFGILLSEENATSNTVPISVAVAQVRYDFNAQLEVLQTADSYDDITMVGEVPDWEDVLAIFAVEVADLDSPDAADVVTIDADRINQLKAVFWDMCAISHQVIVTEHPDSNPDDDIDDSWIEKDLNITITTKTASDMAFAYGFTAHQISVLNELLLQRDVLLELAGNLTAISADTAVVLRNLPQDLSEERCAVIRTACSLVGKINYFWGGKSHVIGWDNRWGKICKVTAANSPTTGTYRPYGMDCSGYVDWVFNNALGYIIGHGGGAMMQHTYCTDITWDEAQIGDLAFYPDDEHVGIVVGWDETGDILIAHCASSYNNVVITNKNGFVSIARPDIFVK